MRNKYKKEVLYIILNKENNNYIIRKYLSQVQEISGILNSTLSKHFNKHKQPYETNHFLIFKCDNVDTKGNYKNNFIN
jgi:hypothetical protein